MDERSEIVEKPGAKEIVKLTHEIELRDVSFGYANSESPVLRNINLRIPAHTMVALVGESGGGKSTLTKLIPRFHDPMSGAVLWDGVDLRDARLDSLRRHIALVTQEVVLFNDTVKYNISYSRPDASIEEIEGAARVAFAHDFISELPDGYETIVGERGVFLSGGQRQRLAIARAVLARRARAHSRRSDFGARRRIRTPRAACPRQSHAPSHNRRDRAPSVNRPTRRSDRRHRTRAHHRDGYSQRTVR